MFLSGCVYRLSQALVLVEGRRCFNCDNHVEWGQALPSAHPSWEYIQSSTHSSFRGSRQRQSPVVHLELFPEGHSIMRLSGAAVKPFSEAPSRGCIHGSFRDCLETLSRAYPCTASRALHNWLFRLTNPSYMHYLELCFAWTTWEHLTFIFALKFKEPNRLQVSIVNPKRQTLFLINTVTPVARGSGGPQKQKNSLSSGYIVGTFRNALLPGNE